MKISSAMIKNDVTTLERVKILNDVISVKRTLIKYQSNYIPVEWLKSNLGLYQNITELRRLKIKNIFK